MSSRKTAKSKNPSASRTGVLDMSHEGKPLALESADPSVGEALQRSLENEDLHRLDLARRLHRDVAGNLVACNAVSEMIRHQLAQGGSAGITTMLAGIDTALRQTLQVVRELTEEQLPPVLTAFGLGAALQQLVKQIGGGFSGSLVLHVNEEELGLDPVRRLCLFRVLQLMIRRCVCDARATRIEVTCLATPGQVECSIDHDGDADPWAGTDGNGELATIKARCALLQGTFHITRSPVGTGLHTRLLVPRSTPAIGG